MKNTLFICLLIIVNFNSKAQTRVVLLEQFSNSGCPPCASYTPPILSYVDANSSKIAAIVYHTAFPYLDSMYYENPVESDARVSFYGSFGVPYSFLDGNYYRNNSANLVNSIDNAVNTRNALNASYAISKNNLSVSNRVITGSFNFKSLQNNSTENLAAFIVVVEKRVEKSDYKASPGKNSETYYSYVMRKFMTDVNGFTLTNKLTNEVNTVDFTWTIENFKDVQELRVIAFVQNLSTKEIYQSMQFNPFETSTGVEENVLQNNFKMYPNPSFQTVHVESKDYSNYNLLVYDALGKVILNEQVYTNTYSFNNLSTGIYLVQFITHAGVISKKLVIQ